MPPATIALIVSLVEEAIKEEPAIVAEFQKVFSKPNPQPSDWQALRDTVLAKKYGDYVPQSAIPASAPVTQS